MAYVKITDRKKPWHIRQASKRNTETVRNVEKIFLIYCEGQNTEPNYFKSFPVAIETRVEVVGTGRSRRSLVEYIIQQSREKEILKGEKNFDEDREIWCVFDKDTKNDENENADFNDAIALARSEGLFIAYSNDSFELWFFLHYHYVDNQLDRSHYFKFLSQEFGINYEEEGKSVNFSKSIYKILLPFQQKAIAHAQKLHKSHDNKLSHSEKNPCTTVYKLVQKLNMRLKK